MMMMPRRKDFDIFDTFFNEPFFDERKGRTFGEVMKTDIREKDDSYELDIDLPGAKKEDIKIELNDGYITVSAMTNKVIDESSKDGSYIHKERFQGECQRSYYAGEGIKEEDIKAAFKNGTLVLTFPKKAEKAVPEKKYIAIEGE